MVGQESIYSVAGPISQDLTGVKLFMQSVLASKPWNRDPVASRKPWNEGAYRLTEHGDGKKLCFGLIWDDLVYKPTPPLWRAMEITKQALIFAGHTG